MNVCFVPKWKNLNADNWYFPFHRAINVIILLSDISAHPDSVNALEGMQDDVRTPDKLIDGLNTGTDSTMWLAPILPGTVSLCNM